jgi:hypothetical protein
VLHVASLRLGVKPFGVARRAGVEGRGHVHLGKIVRPDDRARQLAVGALRGDKRRDHHHAGLHKEFRHFGDAADVFRPICVGEPKVAVEPAADVVAIEQVGGKTLGVETALQSDREGALARPGQPIQPDHPAALFQLGLFVRPSEDAVENGIEVVGRGSGHKFSKLMNF